MKKVIVLALVACMLVMVFVGCTAKPSDPEPSEQPSAEAPEEPNAETLEEPETPEDPGTEAKGGYKVALHNAFNNNGWRVRFENQIQEVVDEYKKAGIISEYATFCSNGDEAVQAQQIEQTINEGYDILLVNPISGGGLDPIIEKALDAGITYVNVDCIYYSDAILNITTDQKYYARKNVEWIVEQMGGKGDLLIFNAIAGNSANDDRESVFDEVLAQYPDINVVDKLYHGWDQTKSKQLMSEFLGTGQSYDYILNQEAGLGILQAIEEAGMPWPKAITSDEEVGYLRKLSEINKDGKELPFFIIENPPGIGATALKFAVRLADGKELKDGMATGDYNAIFAPPQWTATYETMDQALADTADLPETEFISTYWSDEMVDSYFK